MCETPGSTYKSIHPFFPSHYFLSAPLPSCHFIFLSDIENFSTPIYTYKQYIYYILIHMDIYFKQSQFVDHNNSFYVIIYRFYRIVIEYISITTK